MSLPPFKKPPFKIPTPALHGHSLSELAMAMIVIGLVVAGLLAGQAVRDNVRMNAAIVQFQELRAAHMMFRDHYKAMPGDMIDARARLPGCTAAHSCRGGDGNRMVGVRINSAETIAASAGVRENIQYWKHLALAGLIDGVNPAASGAPGTSAYGLSHPAARLGGGWNAIMTSAEGYGDYGGSGLIFQFTAAPNTNAPVIGPRLARRFDAKIDDGRPNTGFVTAEDSVATNCDDDRSNTYRTAIRTRECVMYFAIQ